MMAAKDPITGEQPKIDPHAELLQVVFASLFDSMKQDFEAYVRKIVTNVLDERDEALLEKLNKIAEAQDKVSATILESSYNKLSKELKEEADKDGWIKWEPELNDHDAFPDISPYVDVQVILRNAVSSWVTRPARSWDWTNEDTDFDIIKYRVVSIN